jgi:hypothetical protein
MAWDLLSVVISCSRSVSHLPTFFQEGTQCGEDMDLRGAIGSRFPGMQCRSCAKGNDQDAAFCCHCGFHPGVPGY